MRLKYFSFVCAAIWMMSCSQDSDTEFDLQESTGDASASEVDSSKSTDASGALDALSEVSRPVEFDGICELMNKTGRCAIGGLIDGECVQLFHAMPETCNGGDDDCDGVIDAAPEGLTWEQHWESGKQDLAERLDAAGEEPVDIRGVICDANESCQVFEPIDYSKETPTYSLATEARRWQENTRSLGSACLGI